MPYVEVNSEYNLKVLFPKLMMEWDYTKNIIDPEHMAPYSHKKVWWKCVHGHEWQTRLYSRTCGNNCPFCSNQMVLEENSLKSTHPELVKELHPHKNQNFNPANYTFGSNKKVWWLCKNGHEWCTTISSRAGTRRTSCPKCTKKYSSIEVRVFSEMNKLFSAHWCYDYYGVEIDIYISSLNIAIEVDGSHWHKNKETNDKNKNSLVLNKGETMIRLREKPLGNIEGCHCVFFESSENHFDIISRLVQKIVEITGDGISYTELIGCDIYDSIVSKYYFPSNSIAEKLEYIEACWDYEANFPLRPENFKCHSHAQVHWKCSKEHTWKAAIYNVSRGGKSCPICAVEKRIKVTDEQISECLSDGMSRKEICNKYSIKNGTLKNRICKMRKKT